MNGSRLQQRLVVPLFGIKVAAPLRMDVVENEFAQRLTLNLFEEPIALDQPPPNASLPPKTKPVVIPVPRAVVRLMPWPSTEMSFEEGKLEVPTGVLPGGFDVFDDLGPIAFRAGPSGLGGFQTITTIDTSKRATAILVLDFDQEVSEATLPFLEGVNPYESVLVESALDGIRLATGLEPHPYKGFHVAGGQLDHRVLKWPLVELQRQSEDLPSSALADLKRSLLLVSQMRAGAHRHVGCGVITLAVDYFYLSSTIGELRTKFLHLMIAFEALFSTPTDSAVTPACTRLARLLGNSKDEYRAINGFLWSTKQPYGCCQIRNEIVHGELTHLRAATYWRLRDIIRQALLKVMEMVASSKINKDRYYESISTFGNRRDAT